MIEIDDVKPGLLVWWKRDWDGGRGADWSCPGVVTAVEEKSFHVKTFDDFKEVGPLLMHADGARKEMRVCSIVEAQRYVQDHTRKREDAVIRARRAFEDAAKVLAMYNVDAAFLMAGTLKL